jgi:hypothetical protein
MATQKPISTISYNTEPFLKEKLDSWISSHIIQAYQYICHKGEDGDKDHIHVRIEPNKKLDPMDLLEELREFPAGQKKPLGCRPFRPSKEEDWILYAVHDKDYLRIKYNDGDKGEKIPYDFQDIKCNEFYDIETAYVRAKSHLKHTSANLASRIRTGELSAMQAIEQGENPFVVNSLMNALSKSDYKRLLEEHSILQAKFDSLLNAIDNYGLRIEYDQDGNIILVPDG